VYGVADEDDLPIDFDICNVVEVEIEDRQRYLVCHLDFHFDDFGFFLLLW